MTLRWLVPILVLVALTALAAPVLAQGEAPTVNEVARELYCPQCTGQTVDVCQIQVCADMREEIAMRLDRGESPEQIKAAFAAQYGQRVLGRPTTRGFDLTAWILPFVITAIAAAAAIGWLRQRTPLERVRPIQQPPGGDYSERLERELRRREP